MKSLLTKKIILISIFSCLCGFASFAQQITKFAVVDTTKVYQAYFRDSASVRNYENKREEFNKELNKLVEELKRLNDQKIEYSRKGDDSAVIRVEALIT